MASGFISFQAALFFAGFSPRANAAALWQTLFQTPHATFQNLSSELSVASGTDGQITYELHSNQGRIDLFARPTDDTPGPPKGLPDLRTLSNPVIERLLTLVSEVTLVRLATVATHHCAVKDIGSANELIAQRVPGLPLLSGATDLSFQINRPFASMVQNELMINRLCRWSTAIGVELMLQVGPGGPIASPVQGRQSIFVEEMLDVNTSPDARPNAELTADLFEEMIKEIIQIRGEGFGRLG